MVSRAGMGVPRATVYWWYRNRAETGFPEKADRIGGTDYWYEDEWAAWHAQHLRAKKEALTRPDRDGDPDDLVDAAGAARILGYASGDVVHANRRLGYFPEPDAWDTARNGHASPRWKRSTVLAAADRRRGKSGRHKPGTAGAPRKPHPYAGDSRLTAAVEMLRTGQQPTAAELAAEWGTSPSTAGRILRTARRMLGR